MDTRDLRTLSVVTAVVVIFTILAVFTFLIVLAAVVPSRPFPPGMWALITIVASGAMGLPAAFALRAAFKRESGNDGNGADS